MYVCTEVAKAWFAESLLRSLKIAYRREGPIPVAEIYCQYYMLISCTWDRRPVYTSCIVPVRAIMHWRVDLHAPSV